MIKNILLITLLTIQFNAAQTLFNGEPNVKVRIINTLDTVKIVFNDQWMLYSKSTNKQFEQNNKEVHFIVENGQIKILENDSQNYIQDNKFVLRCANKAGTLVIKNVPYGVGWWWQNKENRIYEGELFFYINKENKFEVVVNLPLEEYLKGVVPYEIGGDSPLEALKAQAVAARSEAIMALTSKLYKGINYDLTSDVECQVFSGNIKRTKASDSAVVLTRSLILSENGKAINAFYASNCGGHSELIKNVWGNRAVSESYNTANPDWEDSLSVDLSAEEQIREWILGNPESFCNANINKELPEWSKNNFRWKRELKNGELNQMNSSANSFGNLLDIKILNRGISGRIYNAKFIFERDSLEVKGELKIRQIFTPPLKSSCFILDKTESGFVIYGAGWGHGVGMCQSGAVSMAQKGYSFNKILEHYYRKAELIKIY